MKSASALGRKRVRLSAFVVVVVVAGLILAVSAAARTSSSSKPHAAPGLTSKGSSERVSRPAADAPGITLYDQYDNPGPFSTNSQNYEAAFNLYDDEAADDFVIPGGLGWNIDTVEVAGEYFNGPGPATTVNVNFYSNGAGELPGTLLQSRPNMAFTNGPSFSIPLSPVVSLGTGTYWVSVQANQTYNTTGQWGWRDRTVTSNAGAAWRNPNGGFQPPLCTSWGRRSTTCNFDASSPDQAYRLLGTTGSASASAATTTATTTAATAATGRLLHGRGDRDPRLRSERSVPVELRRLRADGDDHRRERVDQRLLAHLHR